MLSKPGSVYKSLETDEEFVARIQQKHRWWTPWDKTTAGIDYEAWVELKMQRRLIERTTER